MLLNQHPKSMSTLIQSYYKMFCIVKALQEHERDNKPRVIKHQRPNVLSKRRLLANRK